MQDQGMAAPAVPAGEDRCASCTLRLPAWCASAFSSGVGAVQSLARIIGWRSSRRRRQALREGEGPAGLARPMRHSDASSKPLCARHRGSPAWPPRHGAGWRTWGAVQQQRSGPDACARASERGAVAVNAARLAGERRLLKECPAPLRNRAPPIAGRPEERLDVEAARIRWSALPPEPRRLPIVHLADLPRTEKKNLLRRVQLPRHPTRSSRHRNHRDAELKLEHSNRGMFAGAPGQPIRLAPHSRFWYPRIKDLCNC